MTLNITQDNTRTEQLGSYGAQIIHKLYELAVDSDNTVTLRGTINSASAYEDDVTYLNTEFGPDLTVNATMQYVSFEDANAAKVCAVFFGDGTGVTKAQMASADFSDNNKHDITVNGQTFTNQTFTNVFRACGATKFNEFKYCTGVSQFGPEHGLQGNSTTLEITLPTTCTTIKGYSFLKGAGQTGSAVTTINGINNVTYFNAFALWGSNLTPVELDFTKITGVYQESNATYAYSNKVTGLVKLNSSYNWDSTKQFNVFSGDRGQYVRKLVFPETFIAENVDVSRTNSCNTFIFLTLTPCTNTISGWRNQNWQQNDYPEGARHMYWPDSICPNTSWTNEGSGNYTNTQTGIKLNYMTEPEPLSNYANISEANKDELISYGCTVTGSSLGNYVVKAPNEP